MDCAIRHPTHCIDEVEKIVLVSYFDNKEDQLQGFECETIYLTNDNIRICGHAILDDLDNYDFTDDLASGTRQSIPTRRRTGRWKRVLNAMLTNRWRQDNTSASFTCGENNCTHKSDYGPMVTSSSKSLDSRPCGKEMRRMTSTNRDGDRVTKLDPRILDFVSRLLHGSKKINVSLLHSTNSMGATEPDALSDDNTACTEQSDLSMDSNGSDNVLTSPSLMEQRLLATGLVNRDDFEFVPDYVSKEVLHLVEDLKATSKHPGPTSNENVSHVKTGIWEVVCFKEDGQPKQPKYIVTGVSMDDRVDTKKLRKFVFAGEEQQQKRRPKLALAPTEIAEALAGYKSGTMAPICHGHNMKLFLEESLIKDVDLRTHRLNVGSGMFGKCLSISAHHFLAIAQSNPEGVTICPFIRTTKTSKS